MTRKLAIGVWVVVVLVYLGEVILLFATADIPSQSGTNPLLQAAQDLAFVLVATLAVVVLRRQPNNAVGWWLMAAGISFPLEGFLYEFAQYGVNTWGAVPVVVAASWVARWVWLLSSINIPFMLLLYPDGRVPSPRWRPALWLMWVVVAIAFVVMGFAVEPFDDLGLENPLGIPALTGAIELLTPVIFTALSLLPIVGAISLVARYRSADALERRQIKLLGWVAGVSIIFFALFDLVDFTPVMGALLNIAYTVFVSAVITAGIIWYRLFDIDRLVSRTVTYALVIACLAAVYAGAVGLLTQILPVKGSVPIAAATLAVAALFNPVRRRFQSWVDRRFNRGRYDAEAIVDGLALRLRDEVDLGGVSAELISVARHTMQPQSVSLWTKDRNVAGTGAE